LLPFFRSRRALPLALRRVQCVARCGAVAPRGLPVGRHHPLSVPREAGLTQAIGRFFTNMRTYELVFVVDPRVSDEDVVAMTQEYKQMISAGGSQVTKEESWGRRKLAYSIPKRNE